MTGRILSAFAFASLAALLEAQPQGTINGPVAGYVFDSTARALRPVLGLPGASLLGGPMRWRFRVDQAFVSPRLDTAVGVTPEGPLRLFRIHGDVVTEIMVGSLAAAGSSYSVAFSPSGASLALYGGN